MVTALLFICLLPVWGCLLPGANQEIGGENRTLARFPDLQTRLTAWPAAIEDWFEDRLAFRRQAVSFAASLGLSQTDLVLEGENGWMFYMGDGSREDLLRHTVLTAEDKNTVRNAQQEVIRRCAEAGAAYAVLVCPDKHSVYQEYLPEAFRNIPGESRLEQILPVLRDIPGLHLADTREAMVQAKGDLPLYYLTDSHWNFLGAWTAAKAAYTVFAEALPGLRVPAEESAETGEKTARRQGDLANMLNRDGMEDYEVPVTLREPQLISQSIPDPEKPGRFTVVYENPDRPDLPRAVVFHDSFGEALRPYIAACFSRTVFVWSDHVRMDVVREEQPDMVIQEYVERLSPAGLALPPSSAE